MYCGAVSGLKTTWMRGRSWEVRWSYSSGRYDNDCLRWHRMASGIAIVQCTVWASPAPPLIPLPPAWNKVLDSAVSLHDLYVVSFTPMTHSSETSSITWIRFPGTDFWYVWHVGPDSSGTRFRHQLELEHSSVPSQKVTEMIYCDWLMKTVDVFMCCYSFIYLCFQPSLFSAPEMSLQMHVERKTGASNTGTENQHWKMELAYGASFWSVCRGH